MGRGKEYDEEFKKEGIKVGKEIGRKGGGDEVWMGKGRVGRWVEKGGMGEIDRGGG